LARADRARQQHEKNQLLRHKEEEGPDRFCKGAGQSVARFYGCDKWQAARKVRLPDLRPNNSAFSIKKLGKFIQHYVLGYYQSELSKVANKQVLVCR
jgi:hypothetical protein